MRLQIGLSTDNRGYSWVRCQGGNVYSKGYLVDPSNDKSYLTGFDLNSFFKHYCSEDELIRDIGRFNGNYSAIICWNDQHITAIVDRQRTFPLFYSVFENELYISDHIDVNSSFFKKTIDEKVFHQFSRTICVYNDKTVYKDIYQIMPSHYLSTGSKKPIQHEYYSYKYNENKELTLEDKLSNLTKRYDEIFERVVQYLSGRQVALPLSGGRDSRLILYHLIKHGHTNIIAFSYGYEGTDDQRLSKIVADYFGVKYYYVHCNRSKMREMSRKHFASYLTFSGNACSLPCVQELYAVHQLMNNHLVEKNCIFIPGHGGDFYAGARAVSIAGDSSDEWVQGVFDHLYFKEYKYLNTDKNEKNREKESRALMEENGILPTKIASSEQASEVVEKYYFYERESKYIQNCVRYYDYWNYEWIAPLEDVPLSELWLTFSLDDRVNRKLLDQWMKRNYPEELYEIGFAGKPKTVLKLQWCYGFIPAIDYFEYLFFKKYVSMNQFVWKKYSKQLLKGSSNE